MGNVLEPALMGRSLDLNTLDVIVSLTFWSYLWGIPGAFLSVPITVVATIICAHIDKLRWAAYFCPVMEI